MKQGSFKGPLMIISLMITHLTLVMLLFKKTFNTGDKKMFRLTVAINHKVGQVTGIPQTDFIAMALLKVVAYVRAEVR